MAMLSSSPAEFLDRLEKMYDITARINNAKRSIIKKRIELGAAPLYTLGFMDIGRQYSTFGCCGLNEALQILGYDILEERGQDFVFTILQTINKKIEQAEKRFKAPHNCEQVTSTCYK